MRIHNIEWFKKNCWYGYRYGNYGYFYLDKFGYLPDEGIELCGKSIKRISGNIYKVIGGIKINNNLIHSVQLPEWFIENNRLLEIE